MIILDLAEKSRDGLHRRCHLRWRSTTLYFGMLAFMGGFIKLTRLETSDVSKI